MSRELSGAERAEVTQALEVLGKYSKKLPRPRDFHSENALNVLNSMFHVQTFEHEGEDDDEEG